jgi:hypothetical protein
LRTFNPLRFLCALCASAVNALYFVLAIQEKEGVRSRRRHALFSASKNSAQHREDDDEREEHERLDEDEAEDH